LAGAFNNSQGDWKIFAPQGFPGSHGVRPKEFGAVEIGCQRYVGPTCQQHQFHLQAVSSWEMKTHGSSGIQKNQPNWLFKHVVYKSV